MDYKDEFIKLTNEYNNLLKEKKDLENKYSSFISEHNSLEREYKSLKDVIATLANCSQYINDYNNDMVESLIEIFYMLRLNGRRPEGVLYYEYRQASFVLTNRSVDLLNAILIDTIELEQQWIEEGVDRHINEIKKCIQLSLENAFPEKIVVPLLVWNNSKQLTLLGVFALITGLETSIDKIFFNKINKLLSYFISSTQDYHRTRRIEVISRAYLDSQLLNKFLKDTKNTPIDKIKISEMVQPLTKKIIIFSTDIQGYTGFSEEIDDATELMSILNTYTALVADSIKRHNGIIDKYIGDGILALFGVLDDNLERDAEDCARKQAVRDSIECAYEVYNISRQFPSRFYERGGMTYRDFFRSRRNNYNFKIRIGINYGEVGIGNIGGSGRYDYTVIGKKVNQADRIQYENKELGTQILISESFKEQIFKLGVCGGGINYKDYVRQVAKNRKVRGLERNGINIYELIDMLHYDGSRRYYEDFKRAFDSFHNHNNPREALQILINNTDMLRNDVPAQLLIEECVSSIRKKLTEM